MWSYQGTTKVGFLAHITETFDKWQLEPTTRTNRINWLTSSSQFKSECHGWMNSIEVLPLGEAPFKNPHVIEIHFSRWH
jgi:hypothetical protein